MAEKLVPGTAGKGALTLQASEDMFVPSVQAATGSTLAVFDHIETRPGGREELLEAVTDDFGYQGILSEHDRYCDKTVPWHWHQEIEFFYVTSGRVVYATPHERRVLSPGSAGFVNANVLHMTQADGGMGGASLLVHEVRPRFLAEPGSAVYRRFVEPLLKATSIELVALEPGAAPAEPGAEAAEARLREQMRDSFEEVTCALPGWEMRVRNALAELWLGFYELVEPRVEQGPAQFDTARDLRLKKMLDYIGLHYPQSVSVEQIAEAAFSSPRECHRTFKEALGVTPTHYLREYRVQQACRMLAHTTRDIGAVARQCGLGTSSHFGQIFKRSMGMTPSEYRQTWQK